MLTNQMLTSTGLIDLATAYDDLFKFFKVPDGVDSQLAIDTIFERYGLTPLYHPDPNWMRFYIGRWSDRNLDVWRKLVDTTAYDYNPIHNVDATEEYTDTKTGNRKLDEGTTSNTKQSGSSSVIDSGSDTAEHTLSADNSDTYEPGSKDTTTRRDTQDSETDNRVDVSGDRLVNEGTSETLTHSLRRFGNIGVTSTQSLIKEQRDVVKFNIYDYIADSFKEEFCLYIY